MAVELKTGALIPPKAPRLPSSPMDYDVLFMDEFIRILRLYFNQIDNFAQPFTSNSGGSYLKFPFIAASDNTIQYATAANTPTKVQWTTFNAGNGFTLNVDNTATATYAGNYKITYSLQFANDDNAAHDAVVWLQVNGVDIPSSSTIFTISARKSAGIPTYVAAYSEVVFPLNAGDTVALFWGTDQAASSGGAVGTYMYYRAAQTTPMPYPETPSAIGSITFVSALY